MISIEEVQKLSQVHDDEGWLSIYLTHDPAADATEDEGSDGSALRLRSHLQALLSWLERAGKDELRARVRDRLNERSTLLDELSAPGRSGVGRALFIGLASGHVHEFDLPVSVGTSAWLDDAPCVRKLLCCLERSRAAGVVVADSEHLTLYEWTPRSLQMQLQLQMVSQLEKNDLENWTAGREKFAQTARNERRKWLEAAAGQVCALATAWQEIVIVSPPEVAEGIRSCCPESLRYIELDSNQVHTPLPILEPIAAQALAEYRKNDRSGLVHELLEQAAAGGPVRLGLAGVQHALQEGRVETLVYDTAARPHFEKPLVQTHGKSSADGYHGVERLIQQALATRARVVVVDGDNAQALADHESVAARLRW